MDEEILAVIETSGVRRWFAGIMLVSLSGVLIYVGLAMTPDPVWQAVSIFFGILGLWLTSRLWRATEFRIELTETEIRDSGGIRIALVEDIAAIDRGFIAFKPSNGFLLRTRSSLPTVWRPGLWWRFGRRIGIGGVTPGAQARILADMLAVRVAKRD